MHRNPSSAERKKLKTLGKCPECRKKMEDLTKVTCEKCRKRRKIRVAKLALKNRCRCGRLIKDSKSRCRICLDKLKNRKKKIVRKSRVCLDCKKQFWKWARSKSKRCKICAQERLKKLNKQRLERLGRKGRCKNCGRKKSEKEKKLAWCFLCRDRNSILGKIRRSKERKKKLYATGWRDSDRETHGR